MKIAFVTTQALTGSTIVGRVLPIAEQLVSVHKVYLLAHRGEEAAPAGITVEYVGRDPFIRTSAGKRRLKGIALIVRMMLNAWNTLLMVVHVQPDVVVVIKSLPQNVLAVFLWRIFNKSKKVILDVDDFELSANRLTSLLQRGAIHWAERTGASMATTIVAATPFLQDHFRQLTAGKKEVQLIVTPLPIDLEPTVSATHTFAYLGSISIASGHRVDLLPDILEQVRAKVPDATLLIAGSGDDRKTLEEAFAARSLREAVRWTDRFALTDVQGLLQDVAVLIDPIDGSITNRSKSSFRVAVAAAAGIPVVTSNIGIRPLLIPSQLHDRFFAAPGDSAAYAQSIIDLLLHPLQDTERSSMRAQSKKHDRLAAAEAYRQLL